MADRWLCPTCAATYDVDVVDLLDDAVDADVRALFDPRSH